MDLDQKPSCVLGEREGNGYEMLELRSVSRVELLVPRIGILVGSSMQLCVDYIALFLNHRSKVNSLLSI